MRLKLEIRKVSDNLLCILYSENEFFGLINFYLFRIKVCEFDYKNVLIGQRQLSLGEKSFRRECQPQ